MKDPFPKERQEKLLHDIRIFSSVEFKDARDMLRGLHHRDKLLKDAFIAGMKYEQGIVHGDSPLCDFTDFLREKGLSEGE